MQSPRQTLIGHWLHHVHYVRGVTPIATAKDWAAVDRLLAHVSTLEDTAVLLERAIDRWPDIAKALRKLGEKPAHMPSLPLIAKHAAAVADMIGQKAA